MSDWNGAERRKGPDPNDCSHHGTAVQLAALAATFESFSHDVGSRMDRWERDVVKIVAEVKSEITSLRAEVREEMAAVKAEHVSLDRFKPVERITYGLVAVLCMGVLGAVLKLVVH